MEQRRVLSISQVNAYLGCPLKYRFQYVDKIPRPWRVAAMAFGTSVHAAVEWFHKERMSGGSPELTQVLQVFDADWYAQNMEPLVFPEKGSYAAPDGEFEAVSHSWQHNFEDIIGALLGAGLTLEWLHEYPKVVWKHFPFLVNHENQWPRMSKTFRHVADLSVKLSRFGPIYLFDRQETAID